MRSPLLASGINQAAGRKDDGRVVIGKRHLLAAGASVLALGIVNPGQAEAANVPGVVQIVEDTIAINLFELDETAPPAVFGADVTANVPGGLAIAEAFVLCGGTASCADPGSVIQWARGTDTAENLANIAGDLTIGAKADAEGGTAVAAGIIQKGFWQVAAADNAATNNMSITGSLTVGANADAIATAGSAIAFAGIGAGVSQVSTTIGNNGFAANILSNSGDLTIAAHANAEAEQYDAAASALIGVGIFQQSTGQAGAAADITNDGSIVIEAIAEANAPNGLALANATATGIVQFADARTEQFSEVTTADGNLVGTTTHTPSGPSSATLTNSGGISILASADALAAGDVAATANLFGIAQVVSGSSAEASIHNSGTINIIATAESEGSESPRGVVFAYGISQVATAYDYQTVETIDPNGVLTYELTSSPVGPAVASFTNTGDITIAGEVDVIALGTGTMDEGLGVAMVDGIDQFAGGNGAQAFFDNSGSIAVSASVAVDSGNVANAVAVATGVDQNATAYAVQTTVVFANGTESTPTTWNVSGTAAGPASVSFDNSGSLTVLAKVESHGDQVAFAGATASAIGQGAAGTDASVEINNSGTIIAVGQLESSGRTAFGGVGAIGFQQGADGTVSASASFENAGTLAVLADGKSVGEAAAFVNATAFAGAQQVYSGGDATAEIINSGTISIGAVASAEAGDTAATDMAMAFADAHGLGQLADGEDASVEFVNSGTFELLAEVDVASDDIAIGEATAEGVIQQIAIGAADGTASASIGNSGEILVGAMADVAAGTTAAAVAGIESAFVQAVIAGEEATATLNNSGSIAMIAKAEALAAGGNSSEFAADLASAQAYVFGINAAATATGLSGIATVSMTNAGSIEIGAFAHATGDAVAGALATAASGLVGSANSAGTGAATVNLTNSGEITLVGKAEATGGHTAHATGIALGGMDAAAASGGDATAALINSGDLTLIADAKAVAGTNALAVAIAIDGFQMTAHAGIGDAIASLDNSGDFSMVANAEASGLNAQAFAIVGGTFFTGAVFQSAAAMDGNASAIAENSGSISVVANAVAKGDVIASASAVGGPGINQFAYATGGDAFAKIDNTGSLEFVAHAKASGANTAYADAIFYNAAAQFAFVGSGGEGSLQFNNEGALDLAVVAEAKGGQVGGALAVVDHNIGQTAIVNGGNATSAFDNEGEINVDVAALAEGALVATASAVLASAIYQGSAALGDGEGTSTFDNSGSIEMTAVASAESEDGFAGSLVTLNGAIIQYAGAGSSQYSFGTTSGGMSSALQELFPTGPATVDFNNSGSIDIAVAGIADGGTSAAADATGYAIRQAARGLDASVSFDNVGSLNIQAGVDANADLIAAANGGITGIRQEATALETTIHMVATESGGQTTNTTTNAVGTASVSFDNSGSFDIVGAAKAVSANGSAGAGMFVHGIAQDVIALDATASLTNDDEMLVAARAEANAATNATAYANAIGYSVISEDLTLDFDNSGEFTVLAEAIADGTSGVASAQAVGATVLANADGFLTGSINNSGDLLVSAKAEGAGDGSAIAQATAVRIGADSSNLAINNSGVLFASASTNDGTAEATAIRLVDSGPAVADPAAQIVITNNGGTIIARRSIDGGQSWVRGTAIDSSTASNRAVVNLVGSGAIYGNIDLGTGHVINVSAGETWFDGIINAECSTIACGQGILNIGAGGALYFRHSGAADGPSGAYLEQLNMSATGTLILEMPTGNDPESAYPKIFTDVANLDGTLLIRSGYTLWDDSYLFDNVIDANTRNGQFDVCGMEGGSALLKLSCVYDGQGNVDLAIDRIAFNEVAGLTRNQKSVGSGIEAVYDVSLDGAFGDMVEQLFTFGGDDYRKAVDQLTGASHAAYLQSFNALGEQQNRLIDQAIGCELPGQEVSSLSCRTGKFNLWGQIDYTSRQSDGDLEAGGYDSDRWTATVGADVEVGPDVIVGASLAKLTNRLDFYDGGRWNADGYQVGAYGAIDHGAFTAKLIGTLAWFDGDSSRQINWTDVGGTLAGQLRADPDARLLTLGAHFGYRVPLSATSLLTPFVNIDHSTAKLKGFTETGLAAANLAVEESKSSRTVVTVGAKWAADLGGVVPQAELGYRRLFGDHRATFDAAFAAEDGSDFEIVSAAEKRGALLAGLSIGGKAGPVDIRVGYQGLFDGNANSHSGNLRIVLPFGGSQGK